MPKFYILPITMSAFFSLSRMDKKIDMLILKKKMVSIKWDVTEKRVNL